jgi:hypothetical protein
MKKTVFGWGDVFDVTRIQVAKDQQTFFGANI